MRFLADMGISPYTVSFLVSLGHDAVHLSELGLHRLSDTAILNRASTDKRVILTHDLGFGELVAAATADTELPSVIIFRLRDMRPESVNRYLSALIQKHGETLQKGAVFSVVEGQIRVRPLPIQY